MDAAKWVFVFIVASISDSKKIGVLFLEIVYSSIHVTINEGTKYIVPSVFVERL